MLYVPQKHLKPGMILARPISCGTTPIPLVVSGQPLSVLIISKLGERNIPGAYIKSEFADDIDVNELFDPAEKEKLIKDISNVYKDVTKYSSISSSSAKAIGLIIDTILDSIFSQPECFLNAIEIKDYDNYTFSHSINVATLCVLIGTQLSLSKSCLSHLAMAGVLHDVGKLDISLDIINKPGKLTDEEFEKMKDHPLMAVRRFTGSPQVPPAVLEAIESHHERFDGTGYRRRLKGQNIPLYGRILALADVYDALTSSRAYRRAWLPHEAIEYMMSNSSTHFDPFLLDTFLRTVASYPIGTISQLSNGYIALVVKNTPDHTTRPTIRVITPIEHRGEVIDLATDYNYLNVTILKTLGDDDKFPQDAVFGSAYSR